MRDMWDELREGVSDGAVKKERPDTSNVTDDVTEEALGMLQDAPYRWDRANGGKPAQRRYTRGVVRGS